MSALSQQYDAAAARLQQINASIATTKATIAADQKQVSHDRTRLSKAAIANYVSDGSASSNNPIFSGNEKTVGAATEYNQIAEGDINLAVDNLHTAENTLNAQQAQLQEQQGQAQQAVATEQAAVKPERPGNTGPEERPGPGERRDRHPGQAAAGAARPRRPRTGAPASPEQAAATTTGRRASTRRSGQLRRPSPDRAGRRWAPCRPPRVSSAFPTCGAPSPRRDRRIPGFDCSGLTAWAWGQVGVGLPHYSGAQMSDSTPVPLSDLEPGDLLFYGPGGSEHVAMYVGPGTMIEAPETGQSVHLTGLRLGGGFVGAGRP